MPQSNGTFTLTINSRTTFGETKSQEQVEIAYLLRQVAQDVQSGNPSRHIIDRNGNDVGSYAFGSGMVNSGR
ncbi:hypothetical protein [Bradyrhizobium lablabi]|uniref:Uncharacterized protein n=1 Tax=Bradyrhizobium lablabi TaxID=722472 RepID=A0A1H5JK93_9BRAD|nr:hypothetical protein [Bradyrhizobium lablabi]SEE52058.1 hypothetical protein SAMN05444171_7834 [Bradyrhizobium lablabi]